MKHIENFEGMNEEFKVPLPTLTAQEVGTYVKEEKWKEMKPYRKTEGRKKEEIKSKE